MSSRARGHLRLVRPEETAENMQDNRPPVTVDTHLRFSCPACGKVQDTDRQVIERWCLGDPGRQGIRAHRPVRMEREEIWG